MSETQALLGKISALRQRLEQAQGLAQEATSAAAALAGRPAPRGRLQTLEQLLADGDDHDARLDHAVRRLTGPRQDELPTLPRRLTARARRLLERARDMLGRMRQLAETFGGSGAGFERADPLALHYRATTALLETTLRMVPLFPDGATAQIPLCEGLETMLDVVAARLRTLAAAVEHYKQEQATIERLAELLAALAAGQEVAVEPFRETAAALLADAAAGGPLRFAEGDPASVPHFVACHSLTVARVVARLVWHDAEWKARAADAVLAALVHDVGMLQVPADLLAQPGPLGDEQRRAIEAHCLAGAELAARLLPGAAWLADAARGHHERLDGTGYPGGLRDTQIPALTRLLAVCDVYAGLCTARPHRPARGTRTALADTLLLADQGLLDREHAERLLHLSFYPVGSAVEMASGAVGVVVAAPGSGRDLANPARPVVTLLLDAGGEPLPGPRHLDLAQSDGQSIVRALTPRERREALGRWFPEWL